MIGGQPKTTRQIVIIAHNLRSCHNVGSILRTADGLGIQKVLLTGYTPYPQTADGDSRMPHIARKIQASIHKTALGAEESVDWQHADDIFAVIQDLQSQGYTIAAVEQSTTSVILPDYDVPEKIALLVGHEVEGVESDVLADCDVVLEIPMFGRKESFNVSVAAALAMYSCRFICSGQAAKPPALLA